ncbi:MAG: tetratricopeptide repeat protein [Saprospiraceae bacterium]|nr:tetratricopeptide repeat protein [Saprospiraceae bacterium]
MNYHLKIIFFLIILLALNAKAYLQSDVLLRKYNTMQGIQKIETGLKVCDSLADYPIEMLVFSKKLLQEAKKIVPKTTLLAKTCKCVSDAYYYSDSIEQSNKYMQNAIHIASSIHPPDNDFIGETFNDLGLNYMDFGKRTEAYDCLLKANQYLKNSSNNSTKADAISNLAVFYHSGGQFEKATELFIQAFTLDKKTGNKQRQSSSLNSLGRVYVDWGKYDTGLKYYFQSLNLLDTVKEKSMIAIRYNNIGMVYQLKNDHKNAINWIDKARKIEEKEGNNQKLAIRYFNLANSYAALKDIKNAEIFYGKSNKIFSEIDQFRELSKVNAALGQLYFDLGQYDKAISFYNKSEEYAYKSGTLPEKANIYKSLYQFYKKTGQFEKALKYYDLHTNAKDSIFNLNASKQVEELEIQYQTAQKEVEINRLESENQVKKKEVTFRKRERNIATFGFIILAVLLGILYRLFNIVKKQKYILANQNEELDRLNKIQNQLFSIISHDFRSITSSYQASAKIIEHYLGKGQPEKLLPIANEITKNSKNLSSMLENLLQWALIRRKGIEPDKKQVIVREEFEKTVEILKDQIESKDNRVEIFSNNDTVWCDTESLNLILRNLIANANKFTQNGIIKLESKTSGENTLVIISDTGTGMSEDTVNSLFSLTKDKTKQGTAGEKGTGLGLLLVSEHLEKNSGTIEINSAPGKGSSFIIKLPAKKI